MGGDIGHEFKAGAFKLRQHIRWWGFDNIDLSIQKGIGAGHSIRNRDEDNAICFRDA